MLRDYDQDTESNRVSWRDGIYKTFSERQKAKQREGRGRSVSDDTKRNGKKDPREIREDRRMLVQVRRRGAYQSLSVSESLGNRLLERVVDTVFSRKAGRLASRQ